MEDSRYAAPMLSLPNGQQAFVHDCIAFMHPKFGSTTVSVEVWLQTCNVCILTFSVGNKFLPTGV